LHASVLAFAHLVSLFGRHFGFYSFWSFEFSLQGPPPTRGGGWDYMSNLERDFFIPRTAFWHIQLGGFLKARSCRGTRRLPNALTGAGASPAFPRAGILTRLQELEIVHDDAKF
jgi:hypothetical protein